MFTSPYNVEFLLGIWGARRLSGEAIQKPARILILGIVVFASFGWVEVYVLHTYPAVLGRIVYGAGSLLILLGIVAGERQKTITMARPLLLLGDASYCLYLIHFPLIGAVLRVYNRFGVLDSASPNVVALSLIVVAVLGAIGLHKWVEAPILGWVNTRLARYGGRATVPAG
jgi:peptidoglycan/LPS O-acetylase OafA/YrhL